MGFLSPAFLIAGLAVAVPLFLHLFHRHEGRRLAFPALRYLLRTEKEHARTIRLRQLLLLLLRIAAIALLVGAGARPFLYGAGGAHDPTAMVIVLDNSMSSGLIREGNRVLDLLKMIATQSIESASDEDRIWLIRAGEPWDLAITGSRGDLLSAIRETDVADTSGDLLAAFERSILLVSGSDLEAGEIHLISDLQASAFRGSPLKAGLEAVPFVVFDERSTERPNTYLDSLVIGGGLAPLANQRTLLSIRISGTVDSPDVPLRLAIGNRILGASSGTSNASTLLPLGPFGMGSVSGYVETDPDNLRGDDRRFFAFQVRPPPMVATAGTSPFFLSEALPVLTDARRVRMTDVRNAEVLMSIAGSGLMEATKEGRATVVLAPPDPTLLPGLNRSLAAVGIPWRYELIPVSGEATVTRWNGSVDLGEVRVRSHYLLIPGSPDLEDGVLARLSSGEPWLVEGVTPRGPYLLLASGLDDQSANLPLTAALIPLLEWMLSRWDVVEGGGDAILAGEPITPPPGATSVRDPRGVLHPLDDTQLFHATRWAGLYQVFQNDSTLGLVAVNTPPQESILKPIARDELRSLLPGSVTIVADSSRWVRSLFSTGKGPEIWRWLLAIAVIVLIAESLVAASGPRTATTRSVGEITRVKRPSAA
ncbi:MAG: BatA domain-containing protein [Gemmatimonadota bacterium]|nr:BatA domain-containing protein [Gemmatimonadota bacterium]